MLWKYCGIGTKENVSGYWLSIMDGIMFGTGFALQQLIYDIMIGVACAPQKLIDDH